MTGSSLPFLAMLREKEGIVYEVLSSLDLDFDTVCELIDGESPESDNLFGVESDKEEKTPTLDHFSRDITQMAKKGKLDPVIGREKEIERVAQVLARRKKNNPVLIGELELVRQRLLKVLRRELSVKQFLGYCIKKNPLSRPCCISLGHKISWSI